MVVGQCYGLVRPPYKKRVVYIVRHRMAVHDVVVVVTGVLLSISELSERKVNVVRRPSRRSHVPQTEKCSDIIALAVGTRKAIDVTLKTRLWMQAENISCGYAWSIHGKCLLRNTFLECLLRVDINIALLASFDAEWWISEVNTSLFFEFNRVVSAAQRQPDAATFVHTCVMRQFDSKFSTIQLIHSPSLCSLPAGGTQTLWRNRTGMLLMWYRSA